MAVRALDTVPSPNYNGYNIYLTAWANFVKQEGGIMERLMSLAGENGFSHWAAADLSAFVPLPSVREMCAADRCGQYGKNWACPPECGSLEAAWQEIGRYRQGLLVQTTGFLADDFDYDGIQRTAEAHRKAFQNFARQARLLHPGCLPLTAGACTLCARCTCPGRPCRFPGKRLSSMEAYGLWVSDICVKSGLPYNYGPQTITYTACVLF